MPASASHRATPVSTRGCRSMPPQAVETLNTACRLARATMRANIGTDKLAVRIGFHFGQALQQDDDVFGDSVNIAARLVELAKAGQIITSGRTMA